MAFAGKVALITGGSKGIGKSTATLLVSLGAKVIINYGRDSTAASDLVAQLGASNCTAVQADASTLTGIDHMVTTAVSQHGHIDYLIANAGVLNLCTVETVTETDFDTSFALNVKGPLFLAQRALPHMPSTGSSRIVMLSTTQCTASTVTPPYTLYNATKGAIDQLVRVMAKDLGREGKRNINVNAVAPGPTGTDLFYEGKSEEMLEGIRGLNPHGRLGRPEELAEAIVWLCGEGSSWVNGQTIRVNGGMA